MAYPGIALVAMVGVGLGLALWYFLTDTNESPHGNGPQPSRDTPSPYNSWEPLGNTRRRRQRGNNTGNIAKDDCPICVEPMGNGSSVTVTCGHIFHHACITKWRETLNGENRGRVTCPLCRHAI